MRSGHAPRFLLVGTGGSSGKTLAMVETAILRRVPEASFLFADTQPFNLRSRGLTPYPGTAEVRVFSPQGCGMRTPTGSQTTNLLLNGGPFAYRRLVDCVSGLFDPRPDVVVICHDRMYVETAILRAARRHGVPTVLLQEGPFCAIGDARPQAAGLRIKAALAPFVNRLGIVPSIPDYGLFGHDRILAASGRYADTWIRAGVPADRIEVTGVPRFDIFAAMPEARPVRRDNGPLRLLYLAQPFAAHRKVSMKAASAALDLLAAGLNQACEEGPLELTIRAHPRAGGHAVKQLCDALAFEPALDSGERPIEHAIRDADATVGHYSTGLLESLMLNRPAICMPIPSSAFAEHSEATKQRWLVSIGIPVCRTPEEIALTLAAQRASNEMKAVLWDVVAEETGIVDGGSAMRVADALLRIATRS